MTIEVVEDGARLMRMREEWNELLTSSAADCLFLTWEWLSTWWKNLSGPRRLFILVVRRKGDAVAIAPLVVRPPGLSSAMPFPALEFMGTGSVGSDYLDLIVRRGFEPLACAALADHLADGKRALDLEQIRASGSAAARLGALLEARGWSVAAETTNLSRYIDLQGLTWDAYLAGLGRAHRQNFQRRWRHLQARHAVRFERVAGEEERAAALRRVVALHRARWGPRGTSNAFHTENHMRFHEEISALAAQRGWLRIDTLWLDDEAVASLYGFRYGPVYSFYQSGFDPAYARYSTGLVIMGLAIRAAIEEGTHEFDMLQGLERYKEHWARASRPLGRLEFYPPRLRGRMYRSAMLVSRAARRAARRVLPKALLDRLVVGRTRAVEG